MQSFANSPKNIASFGESAHYIDESRRRIARGHRLNYGVHHVVSKTLGRIEQSLKRLQDLDHQLR